MIVAFSARAPLNSLIYIQQSSGQRSSSGEELLCQCPHGSMHSPEILPVKNGYFMRCQMTVIWVLMQCGGHLSSRAMMGHIAHTALIHQVPCGSAEPRQGWPARPPVLPQPSQFPTVPCGSPRRLALHTEPRRISRATQRHRLHHRLQTALSGEAQEGVWQCHIPSPCSKNTPPPSKRLDFHSSDPFNICSFTRTWNCTPWERRQAQIRTNFQ